MATKHIDDETFYDDIDPLLSDFVDLSEASGESNLPLFDEIATVEARYEDCTLVDQGGMKKILKTTDVLTKRPVAKAVLTNCDDESKIEEFLREARLTAALEHPNIVPVYDIGVDEADGPYFIMKLVGGKNLSTILKKHASDHSLHDFMEIFIKVCDAVAYAHSKGIVHLDLKPANVQIEGFGEVLVCDWGLAKVVGEADDATTAELELDPVEYNHMTMDGVIKGTPGFMAPEQIDMELGPKDERTDVYALGGILYSLLTLKNPHQSETVDGVFKDTLAGNILPPSDRTRNDVPASLESVAMKALRPDPQLRYQSVAELRQEINKWLGGFATEAENASFFKSFLLLLNRHKIASALLAVLVVSVVASFMLVRNSEQAAIANEAKATSALIALEEEQRVKKQVSQHAIEQLEVINEKYLNNFEFEQALILIENASTLYPDSELINALKGELYFYVQRFPEAKAAFERAGRLKSTSPYDVMLKLTTKYPDAAQMTATQLVDVTQALGRRDNERFMKFMIAELSSMKNYLELYATESGKKRIARNIDYCHLMNLQHIKRASKDHFSSARLNVSYTLSEEGIHLDLSNSKGVESVPLFRHLPLASVSIENTFFWRRWIFNHYSLKSVNIRNSRIDKLNRNDYANKLTEIILTREQYEASAQMHRSQKERITMTIR